MAEVTFLLPEIMLYVNRLNPSVKMQKLAEWIENKK